MLSNDLSEMRRSSISQESEFVFKTDCGGFTKNAILSQPLRAKLHQKYDRKDRMTSTITNNYCKVREAIQFTIYESVT